MFASYSRPPLRHLKILFVDSRALCNLKRYYYVHSLTRKCIGNEATRKTFFQALLLLNQLDWSLHGPQLMGCLNSAFNRLARLQPKVSRKKEFFYRKKWNAVVSCQDRCFDSSETLMEMCLGLFYAPGKPVQDQVGSRKS